MKNKSLKLGMPYFFRSRLQDRISLGTIPVSIKPESEKERTESALEDTLRWADDGGQVFDPGQLITRSDPDTAQEQPGE